MVDQNQSQTPQVGPVGQQAAPQQTGVTPQQAQAQQPVSRGIPGVQQPPRPTPEQIQEVMRKQQQQTAADQAEAKRRAQQMQPPQPGNPVQSMQLPAQPVQPQMQIPVQQVPQSQAVPQVQQQMPAYIAAQMPPQMQQAVQPVQQAQTVPSPVQGLTAAQVMAGYQDPGAQVSQPGGQFAQYAEPQVKEKEEISWYPIRGGGVQIELTDYIIKNVPAEGMIAEGDAQAKVVLALFSEILAQREIIAHLRQSQGQTNLPPDLMARIQRLEGALFNQSSGMQQRARGIREQIDICQAKGMSADETLAFLNGQSKAAEAIAAKGGDIPSAPVSQEQSSGGSA